jgi:hypothetical protein
VAWLREIATVQVYLQADLALKEPALTKADNRRIHPGPLSGTRHLIAFLDSL